MINIISTRTRTWNANWQPTWMVDDVIKMAAITWRQHGGGVVKWGREAVMRTKWWWTDEVVMVTTINSRSSRQLMQTMWSTEQTDKHTYIHTTSATASQTRSSAVVEGLRDGLGLAQSGPFTSATAKLMSAISFLPFVYQSRQFYEDRFRTFWGNWSDVPIFAKSQREMHILTSYARSYWTTAHQIYIECRSLSKSELRSKSFNKCRNISVPNECGYANFAELASSPKVVAMATSLKRSENAGSDWLSTIIFYHLLKIWQKSVR